jgi:predicted esterase
MSSQYVKIIPVKEVVILQTGFRLPEITIMNDVCNRWFVFVSLGFGVAASLSSSHAQTGPTERKVAAPTRLDWAFAARGFGAGAAKLPADYDSTKQRYQLFVPKGYRKDKAWPMVLFISPGDGPMGWKNWQKLCEEQGIFFASPLNAGNSTATGLRTRIILDVLDDVRRQFRIDPDQTYLTGFSGGGRMACAIGFALPEYFGGVMPVCGTNPIMEPTYIRHRVEERLSVAFVTGETDFNRKENEVYMTPWFEEIGVRSKCWVVPKMGHAIPSPAVISEAHAWLAADLKRRRDDAKARPKLTVSADDTPNGSEQARRLFKTAGDDLMNKARTWRGVALLQGTVQRWGTTASGKQAQGMLKKVVDDETMLQRIGNQGTEDEVKSVSAQAKAQERFGKTAKAIEAWELLTKNYADTPIGMKAADNIKRLRAKGK